MATIPPASTSHDSPHEHFTHELRLARDLLDRQGTPSILHSLRNYYVRRTHPGPYYDLGSGVYIPAYDPNASIGERETEPLQMWGSQISIIKRKKTLASP